LAGVQRGVVAPDIANVSAGSVEDAPRFPAAIVAGAKFDGVAVIADRLDRADWNLIAVAIIDAIDTPCDKIQRRYSIGADRLNEASQNGFIIIGVWKFEAGARQKLNRANSY
jgi:hypothetical protein